MTDEEADKIYDEFESRIGRATVRRDAYKIALEASEKELEAIFEERDAWERTI